MADTYCGKTCGQCIKKQNGECVGCVTEKEGAKSETCEVAKCCKDGHHSSCFKCGTRLNCVTYHKAKTPNAGFISSWVAKLFIMSILVVIASLFTAEIVTKNAPMVGKVGAAICVTFEIIYALILIVLAKVNYGYKLAGVFALITQAVSTVAVVVGENTLPGVIIGIVAAIISLAAAYNEIEAHASILYDVEDRLAEKWRTLWTIYICVNLAMILGIVLLFILPGIGAMLVLGAYVGSIIAIILKAVYLNKTSKVFRGISER